MINLGIVVFLIIFGYVVYYVINLLIKQRMIENLEQPDTINASNSTSNATFSPDRTIHQFLNTEIMPGKIDIVNLKESNPHNSNYFYLDHNERNKVEIPNRKVSTPKPSKLTYHRLKENDQLMCITNKDPIRQSIKDYQPYMYDQGEIINYYDRPFYRDWRYPERPIDPNFAANAEKYCANQPNVYPCYRYYSRW